MSVFFPFQSPPTAVAGVAPNAYPGLLQPNALLSPQVANPSIPQGFRSASQPSAPAFPNGSLGWAPSSASGFQLPAFQNAGLRPFSAEQLPTLSPSPVEPVGVPALPPQVPVQQIPNPIPTELGIERFDPKAVYQLLRDRQCVLIDLRTYDLDSGMIDGAMNVASQEFPMVVPNLVQRLANERLVVFTCQYSAHRSPQCANWYKEGAPPGQRIAIMTGGFRGWEAAGLPVRGAAQSSYVNQAADAFALQQGVDLNKMRSYMIAR